MLMVLADVTTDFAWSAWTLKAVVRLLMAAVLGAIIGLEREQHGRAAGLRTHLLVSLGAALAMVVSLHFGEIYGDRGGAIQVDPARVAYGVMAGIGFLGAGAIIHYGAGVRGLTTAASLWCTAAIGLASGFGMFLVAAVAVAIVLFALVVLDFVDRCIPAKASKTVTVLVPDTSDEAVRRYCDLLSEAGAKVVNVEFTRDFEKNQAAIHLRISVRSAHLHDALRALREGAPEITKMSVE
jgi:putative Mg2+ transporter-C (MgtC) family protein